MIEKKNTFKFDFRTDEILKKNKQFFKKKKVIFYSNKYIFINKKVKKKKKKHIYKVIKNYLYKNNKTKKSIFLKEPKLFEVFYPFSINMKLINESI